MLFYIAHFNLIIFCKLYKFTKSGIMICNNNIITIHIPIHVMSKWIMTKIMLNDFISSDALF